MADKQSNIVMKTAMEHKLKLLLMIILNIIGTVGRIVIYYFIYKVIEEIVIKKAVVDNIDMDIISNIITKMCICIVVTILSIILASILSHNVAYSIGFDLRNSLIRKLSNVELGFFTRNRGGEIKKTVSEDCAVIEDFFAEPIGDFVSGIVTPLSIIVLMFTVDFKMTIGALISIPLAFVGILLIMLSKNYIHANKSYNTSMGKITADVVEYFKALAVVRIFNSKGRREEALRQDIDDIYKYTYEQGKYSRFGYVFFTTFITASLLGILGMSIYEYTSGVKNSILIINILFFYIVGANLAGPLMNLTIFTLSLRKFTASSEKINHILNEHEMINKADKSSIKDGNIEFKNVKFGYGDGRIILNDCNLKIPEGKVTAIIGPSGSGKTTILRLLAGFWNSYEGEIRIGGKELKNMSQEELYSNIGFVFQDNLILSDTVEANIRMNNELATMDDIILAAKKAQIHDLIMSLPDKYQTIIGEGGENLSGGEKQRIAISRIFIKNSPILILDEATSYADVENENLIYEALEELMKNKTVIMIAHKLSVIRRADNIIILDKGKEIDSGTDEQLANRSDYYRDMLEQYISSQQWKLERSQI